MPAGNFCLVIYGMVFSVRQTWFCGAHVRLSCLCPERSLALTFVPRTDHDSAIATLNLKAFSVNANATCNTFITKNIRSVMFNVCLLARCSAVNVHLCGGGMMEVSEGRQCPHGTACTIGRAPQTAHAIERGDRVRGRYIHQPSRRIGGMSERVRFDDR